MLSDNRTEVNSIDYDYGREICNSDDSSSFLLSPIGVPVGLSATYK